MLDLPSLHGFMKATSYFATTTATKPTKIRSVLDAIVHAKLTHKTHTITRVQTLGADSDIFIETMRQMNFNSKNFLRDNMWSTNAMRQRCQ